MVPPTRPRPCVSRPHKQTLTTPMAGPTANPVWLSVSEAAAHLGVSVNAVKQRVKRRTLLATRNNQGRLMVSVEPEPTRPRPTVSRPPETDPPTPMPTPLDPPAVQEGVMPASIHLTVVERLQAAHSDAMEQRQRQHEAELSRTVAAMRWERVWFVVVLAVMALLVLAPVFAGRH